MDTRGEADRTRAATWATVLDDFIDRESRGRSAATCRRYARVRGRWREMLDELGVDGDLGAAVLVECVPAFLDDEWLLDSDADARTQVSLTTRLMTRLRLTRLVVPRQMLRGWLDAEAAVFQARERVRARPPRHRRETAAPHDRPALTLIHGGLTDRQGESVGDGRRITPRAGRSLPTLD
ncbi:MAG: hypothetical protein JWP31_1416 [Aeromicrobium sp.]|nr:hypothetical protein [Aeromicrobium sp.]